MAAQTKFERRALIISTACTVIAFLVEIVAICTNNWLVLTRSDGAFVDRNASGKYPVEVFWGLWRTCSVEVSRAVGDNGDAVETTSEVCEAHNLFPSEEEIRENKEIEHYLDYTRTAIAFTIIGIVLMVIGHLFAIYTLKHTRYIIKRLTGLLHLMTAGCILVLNEVFSRSVEHEMRTAVNFPQSMTSSYGFSYILSWIVFVMYVGAGLVFLFLSHKRKAEMADTVDVLAEQDEPMQLGRV